MQSKANKKLLLLLLILLVFTTATISAIYLSENTSPKQPEQVETTKQLNLEEFGNKFISNTNANKKRSADLYNPEVQGEFNLPRGRFVSYKDGVLKIIDYLSNLPYTLSVAEDKIKFTCTNGQVYKGTSPSLLYDYYINVARQRLDSRINLIDDEKEVSRTKYYPETNDIRLVFYAAYEMKAFEKGDIDAKVIFVGCDENPS